MSFNIEEPEKDVPPVLSDDEDADTDEENLLQTVIPAKRCDSERQDVDKAVIDETDSSMFEEEIEDYDDHDQDALKAAYLAVLASEDITDADEPLDISLEEEEEEYEGSPIGMDEVDDSNIVPENTLVASNIRSIVEQANTGELTDTADTVKMQTVINQKQEMVDDDVIPKERSDSNSKQVIVEPDPLKTNFGQDPCTEEISKPSSSTDHILDAVPSLDLSATFSTTPRSASSAEGEEKIVIIRENGDQNCHSEFTINPSISTILEASNEIVTENQEEKLAKLKKYPDFIESFEERLQVHYVSRFAKECPLPWFRVPNKPDCQIYLDVPVTERINGKTESVSIIDFKLKAGERILIQGTNGSGKTTFLHKLVYDYGLGLLPAISERKLVFLLEAPRWKTESSLKNVLSEQILQEAWGIDINKLYDWMLNNPEECLFIVDHIDDLYENCSDHPIYTLVNGQVFADSAVILASALGKVILSRDCYHRQIITQSFSAEQINEFIDLFIGEKANSVSFKNALSQDYRTKGFYKTPLHLALICTLFLCREVDLTEIPISQTELFDKAFTFLLHLLGQDFPGNSSHDTSNDLLPVYEDVAYVLSKAALCSLKDRKLHFSKDELKIAFDINSDVLDLFIDYGLIEKVICQDMYFFPCLPFRDFLAAKFVAIQYYHAANSGQLGVGSDLQEMTKLFDLCWSCHNDDNRCSRLCVYVSGLLRRDCNLFIESLVKQYSNASDLPTKQSFLRLAFACICENIRCKGFVSLIADSFSDMMKLNMDLIHQGDTTPSLDGVAHIINAGKLTYLDLTKLSFDDVESSNAICTAISEADRLRSVVVDFTKFQPVRAQNSDLIDNSFLKKFLKSLGGNCSIKDMSVQMDVGAMSREMLEVSSRFFLSVPHELKSLNIQIGLTAFSPYLEDKPALASNIELFEKLNLIVSRVNVFLQNNRTLETLELNGCFLHKDVLPEIKTSIVNHTGITSLHIGGKRAGTPYHREGVLALTDILEAKMLTSVAVDLNSFVSSKKQTEKFRQTELYDSSLLGEYTNYEHEIIATKLLRSLQKNESLENVRFSCDSVDCCLMDLISDFVELSPSLKHLEVCCESIDDLFLLFLGCGILCSSCLESVTLEGCVHSGGGLAMFLQSCCQSLCLKELAIVGKPFTEDCLEWLLFILSNFPLHPVQPFQITLSGQTQEVQGNIAKIISDLKDIELPLDILMEIDLS
ncbi:uncharacterized protein LOC141899459 [Tubulanus polymorphus]|uniref:uncharacterized protein LOC141899459 n=1 Tax=Tubulanus polymorphus TaxID=672921 RepID=UPI003DA54B9A